jgi:hypothetical protein
LGLPEPRPLCHGTFEACLDPLPDHRSLELGKGTADLKHKLSHWRPQCLGTAALVEAFRMAYEDKLAKNKEREEKRAEAAKRNAGRPTGKSRRLIVNCP